MKKLFLWGALCLLSFHASAQTGAKITPAGGDRFYPRIESEAMPGPDSLGNIIPDFSRVGYRWGDQPIPDVPVIRIVRPPRDGSDAREMIQQMIDRVAAFSLKKGHRGTILLKKGTYNISGPLYIRESGIVLRGEGDSEEGTILMATATRKHNLIVFSGNKTMTPSEPAGEANIKDDYVPVGRFWVRVTNPDEFRVGDQVILYRPASAQWISDLQMDRIRVRKGVKQWTPEEYVVRMERVVTMIAGDTLHFDNPCVMSIDARYGRGSVFKYKYKKRLNECGVENILFRSAYDGDTDENHGWSAVDFRTVEHSWVRNVTSEYFGYGTVSIDRTSKNITVENCECRLAKSIITGGRRYSFNVSGSLNLIIGCRAMDGRHDYVTGSRQAGPNVFVNSTAERTHSDIGPHHRWNMGTLYDNIRTDGAINVQDRQWYGSGHGWAGANQVLWNCTATSVIVQSPWTSAVNYSIGTVGEKKPGAFAPRPDGVWISPGVPVQPGSLYEAQLQLRRSLYPGGIFSVGK